MSDRGISVRTFYPPNNKSCAISKMEKQTQDGMYDKIRTQSVTSTPYHRLRHGHHVKSMSPVDDSGYQSINSTITDTPSIKEGTPALLGRHLAFSPLSPVLCERTVATYQPSFSEISRLQHDGDWDMPDMGAETFQDSYHQPVPQNRLNFEVDVDDACEDSASVGDLDTSCGSSSCVAKCIVHPNSPLTDSPKFRFNFECEQDDEYDCQCSVYISEVSELNSTSSFSTSSLADRFDEVLKKFSPKEPDRLIGRKMGLLCVDIMAELSVRNIGCLSEILQYLHPSDLCSFCQVNRDWKSICDDDKRATDCRTQYIQRQRKATSHRQKENVGKRLEKRQERGLTEGPTFGTIQCTVSPSSTGRLHSQNLFQSVASTLKNYESLRKCPLCQGPSKVLEVQERGMCAQSDCGFDFCVKCFSNFHFERACVLPASVKRIKTTSIGSRKSKKNLKRL